VILYIPLCYSDGSSIDKVYVPYVQPLEKEFETRFMVEKDNAQTLETYYLNKTAFGFSINERLFSEFYIITEDDKSMQPKTRAYEIELRYQLTEQGEYSLDFGAMFELEKYARKNIWEAKTGLLTKGQ